MTPQELRSRRQAIGISVGELAFEVRLPIRAVHDIENGNRDVPHAEIFLRAFERLERGYVVRRATTTPDS
ncbi:MAG TPA: helix-turn-helix domain-containing protein [Thermoanaerobaculia bacterium]